MDELDRAALAAQTLLDASLTRRREEGPQATGLCLYCEEEILSGRWCSVECREQWEFERRLGE